MAVPSAPAGRLKVLIVDDEAPVLDTTAAILEAEFDVETAGNATEALRKLQSGGVDVLCTDLQMPQMNGIELIRAARAAFPQVASVLTTGFEEFLSRQRMDTDSFLLLMKPYAPQKLIEVIQQAGRLVTIRKALDNIQPARRE